MHSLHLLAEAMPASGYTAEPLPDDPAPGTCCLTGWECDTIPRRRLLGPSFTDLDLLARPDSDRISVAAWTAFTAGELRDGKARRYCPERMSSWQCTQDRFQPLSRQQVRDAVLGDAPAVPWCGYATTSYKKHGSLRAPVNGPGQAMWLWEMRLVDCSDRDQVSEWWQRLRHYQDAGIPRPVLETAEPEAHLVRKIGIPLALEYTAWAHRIVDSALYQFLVYLLPSTEELREQDKSQSPGVEDPRKDASIPPQNATPDLFA